MGEGAGIALHRLPEAAERDASVFTSDLLSFQHLVVGPAFLVMAWAGGIRGARTAGVDGVTAHYIGEVCGVELFLTDLRAVGPDTRVACASVVRW